MSFQHSRFQKVKTCTHIFFFTAQKQILKRFYEATSHFTSHALQVSWTINAVRKLETPVLPPWWRSLCSLRWCKAWEVSAPPVELYQNVKPFENVRKICSVIQVNENDVSQANVLNTTLQSKCMWRNKMIVSNLQKVTHFSPNWNVFQMKCCSLKRSITRGCGSFLALWYLR